MNIYKTIRIYRHGETEWNRKGLLQGWLDSPLTERGKQQARAVDWQPEVVYASDLGRAVTTAQLMFPKKRVTQECRLREIFLGEWQGQEIAELMSHSAYRSYCEQPEAFIAVSQEPFSNVAERMMEFCESLLHIPHQHIAVVSHGVAIACLHAAIEQRPISTLWQKGMLPGGGYLTIEYSRGEWCVKKMTLQKI
jgi:broad specificity phosphatase PhoE